MEELYDIVDENNNLLGFTKTKTEVHKEGCWHRAVHVWALNQNGEILVQKRAAIKTFSPNLWDISMGGHISAGEEPVKAAVRELKEELNLEVSQENLQYIYLDKHEVILHNGIERLFHYVYIVRTALPVENFKIQEEEVAEIKYISLSEFEQEVKNHPKLWMSHTDEYSYMFEYLKNHA